MCACARHVQLSSLPAPPRPSPLGPHPHTHTHPTRPRQAAKPVWDFWYEFLHRGCLHGRDCVRRKRDGACNHGSRFIRYHLISGGLPA